MIIRNATASDIQYALVATNKLYRDNLIINMESRGAAYKVKMGVIDSRGYGSRVSISGRRVSAACWHVFGHFFDWLFRIAPDAKVVASNRTITRSAGNWIDWNMGSEYEPASYSTLCDCVDKARPRETPRKTSRSPRTSPRAPR